MNATIKIPFEQSFAALFQDELSKLMISIMEPATAPHKHYWTMEETAERTGIGMYVLRRLTRKRAMPHRLVRKRIIFDESEIESTIANYKTLAWEDPDKNWDVGRVRFEIEELRKKKEETFVIEDILRKLIKEELAQFSEDILSQTKKDHERYYGRTNLTLKEAAKHFRVSPATMNALIKQDGMPHYRIRSQYYIVLEEAEAFLWRETARDGKRIRKHGQCLLDANIRTTGLGGEE